MAGSAGVVVSTLSYGEDGLTPAGAGVQLVVSFD